MIDIVTQQLQQSQILSGGIILMVFGGALALLRGVPASFLRWLRSSFIVSVRVTNDDPIFEWISIWMSKHPYSNRSRRMIAQSHTLHYSYTDNSDDMMVSFSPAIGAHFFRYRNHLVWFHRERSDSVSLQSKKAYIETYDIRIFGRRPNSIKEIIFDAKRSADAEKNGLLQVYRARNGYWDRIGAQKPRYLDSVFLNEGVVDSVGKDIETFLNSQQWYHKMGIPYRRGYLFYGIPGTGKTSIVLALCGTFRLPLYILSLNEKEMDDTALSYLIMSLPVGSVILIEDIDSIFVGRGTEDDAHVTFSGLLNAIDGASAGSGRILCMTTNHPELLDPALIRPGRIDYRIEFGYTTSHQAATIFRRFFPDVSDWDVDHFSAFVESQMVSMATLQEYLLLYRYDVDTALRNVESLARETSPSYDLTPV